MYIQLTLKKSISKFSITLQACNGELTAVTKLTKLAKVANPREKFPLDSAAFNLLASIKLPHIQCGDPMV